MVDAWCVSCFTSSQLTLKQKSSLESKRKHKEAQRQSSFTSTFPPEVITNASVSEATEPEYQTKVVCLHFDRWSSRIFNVSKPH